jgi:hypothetical protein
LSNDFFAEERAKTEQNVLEPGEQGQGTGGIEEVSLELSRGGPE